MENLIFCLNATVPVFLLMVLGIVFRKLGLIDAGFASKLNKYVFVVALPVLLFRDMAAMDYRAAFDGKFILFCFFSTLASILIALLLSLTQKERAIRGEMVQVSYRSSAALLGIAFIQNIYGTSRMAPLMILGSVPLYNVAAVLVLTLMRPTHERRLDAAVLRKLLRDVATNPILIAIVVGFLWSFLRVPTPGILDSVLSKLAATATPLGLMALGASFDSEKALAKWKPTVLCTALKLLVFAAIFLPVAVALGFREDKLLSGLIMLASPATVSCFIMAKNMGYDGSLSASVLLSTTVLGAFTLTGWLWVLKTFALL